MSDMQYDAIIIGGGHNGLVCANILGKKNKKVLVCEARENCGGMVNHEIINYVFKDPTMKIFTIWSLYNFFKK